MDRRKSRFIVCHVYLERRLMCDATPEYNPASASCSKVKFDLRKA